MDSNNFYLAKLYLATPATTHSKVQRLNEVNKILRDKLDKETYDLVAEAAELSMDILAESIGITK